MSALLRFQTNALTSRNAGTVNRDTNQTALMFDSGKGDWVMGRGWRQELRERGKGGKDSNARPRFTNSLCSVNRSSYSFLCLFFFFHFFFFHFFFFSLFFLFSFSLLSSLRHSKLSYIFCSRVPLLILVNLRMIAKIYQYRYSNELGYRESNI